MADMGVIRKAIVRAAPTCTLWRSPGWNIDELHFVPGIWPQRVALRITWATTGPVNAAAWAVARWIARWGIISRRELEEAIDG